MDVEDLIRKAARNSECHYDEVLWYSWPETFGTTGGPSGFGGCAITTYQVYAFDAAGELSRYCAGHWRQWNGEFKQKWYA